MGRQPYGDRRDRPPVEKPRVDVQKIMTEGASKEMIDQAEAFGRYLAKLGLTTAQIRNIFGTVREIEMTWQADAKPEEVAKAQTAVDHAEAEDGLPGQARSKARSRYGVQDLAASFRRPSTWSATTGSGSRTSWISSKRSWPITPPRAAGTTRGYNR